MVKLLSVIAISYHKNFQASLTTILTHRGLENDTEQRIREIDAEMLTVQEQLAGRAMENKDYTDLTAEVERLRDEKQSLLLEQAKVHGKELMRQDMVDFLAEQTAEITEFDDQLVRKLIEQVVIHSDGTMTVVFKSGIKTNA